MLNNFTKRLMSVVIVFVMVLTVAGQTAFANQTYKDVGSGFDGYEEIQYIHTRDIIKGYPDGTYRPHNRLTRSQAAKMLVIASGNTAPAVTKSSYPDVNVRLYPEAARYIERATQLGFMKADSNGNFNMNGELKRSDMAVALTKAFNLNVATYANHKNPFTDVQTGTELSKAVNAIYYEGIAQGDDALYKPTSGVTRKHFALFIARGLNDSFKVNKDVAGVEAPNSALAIAKAKVNLQNDPLNVRSAANTTSSILGKLSPQRVVDVYEMQGKWLKIGFNNTFGYIHSDYTVWTDQSGQTIGSPTGKVTITTSELNVRARATVSSPIVGMVVRNEVINVYRETNGWYLILLNGVPGYISKTYTTPTTTTPTPPPTTNPGTPAGSVLGKVTSNGLSVRTGPSASHQMVEQLARGKMVEVKSINGYWAQIAYDGKTGYAHKTYLKLLNQTGSPVKDRIIVIDAGHGGTDPGAVRNGVTEKSIVLKVAKLVQQKLEKDGAKVVMTRESDTFPSLQDRVELSKQQHAEIFVSIHVNAFTDSTARGTETYYNTTYNDNGLESYALAVEIHQNIVRDANMFDRRIKENSLYVNRMVDIPSILLELGFISNPGDFAKLTDSAYIEKYAHAIYKGTVSYYSKP